MTWIQSLIREREMRSDAAAREIGEMWAFPQTISGIYLVVPYTELVQNEKEEWVKVDRYAYFLPDSLLIKGEIIPEKRYRGIYEVMVYKSKLSLQGNIQVPDWASFNIPRENIQWNEVRFEIGISDLRGINNKLQLNTGNRLNDFEPGLMTNAVSSSGVGTIFREIREMESGRTLDFSMDMDLRGSEHMSFSPLGRTTTISLASSWPSPSFTGSFLPEQRTVEANGFKADWKVLHLNRNFPQHWKNNVSSNNIRSADFGVDLLIPVDHYQKNTRAAKYAILLIGLSFLVFFFIEIIQRQRIHPIQYILVGLALSIFYTLLLALSEHISFAASYWIGALVVWMIIGAYTFAVFPQKKLAYAIMGILAAVYVYIFVVLQLEDYALLIGSLGLLLIISSIMYLTRKIDWYKIQREA